jgi:hypothetical protein
MIYRWRWLTAYYEADPALHYEGREQLGADFADVEVADSRGLIDVLPSLTDQLLSTDIPKPD